MRIRSKYGSQNCLKYLLFTPFFSQKKKKSSETEKNLNGVKVARGSGRSSPLRKNSFTDIFYQDHFRLGPILHATEANVVLATF